MIVRRALREAKADTVFKPLDTLLSQPHRGRNAFAGDPREDPVPNSFRDFANNTPNEFILSQLRRCQDELHQWGFANSVSFDAKKESFHILSRTDSFGCSFKLLGVTLDVQLTMAEAVHECSVEAQWRLSSLLRSRRFFTTRDVVVHYKSHVLSFLEYRTSAITHAADVHLHAIDAVQRRFLRHLNVSPYEALHVFNLSPLSTRRDIANLGVIYRAAIRRGPKQLQEFFKLDVVLRRSSPRRELHQYQVVDSVRGLHREYLNRSTFGYVAIFNILPEIVFSSAEFDLPIPVKEFQKNLSRLVRRASFDIDDWDHLYNPRLPLSSHSLLQFRRLGDL